MQNADDQVLQTTDGMHTQRKKNRRMSKDEIRILMKRSIKGYIIGEEEEKSDRIKSKICGYVEDNI